MNKMIRFTLVAAAMAVLPASASEVGILIDKQVGQSIDIPGTGASINAVSPTGYGLRGAFTVLDLKVAELGIAATYHSKATTDLEVSSGSTKVNLGKAGSEYIALGVQADWKFMVNLHLGLDMRREKISNENVAGLSARGGDTTITRPWLSAGIGFSIPLPVVSPFIRLEAAYALKNYSTTLSINTSDDDFRKAMAAKYQIALYGGIRF